MSDPAFAQLLEQAAAYGQQELKSDPFYRSSQTLAQIKPTQTSPLAALLSTVGPGLVSGLYEDMATSNSRAAEARAAEQLGALYTNPNAGYESVEEGLRPFAQKLLAARNAEALKQQQKREEEQRKLERGLQLEYGKSIFGGNRSLSGSDALIQKTAQGMGLIGGEGGGKGYAVQPPGPPGTPGASSSSDIQTIPLEERIKKITLEHEPKVRDALIERELELDKEKGKELKEFINTSYDSTQKLDAQISELQSALIRSGETGGVVPIVEDSIRGMKLKAQEMAGNPEAAARVKGRQDLTKTEIDFIRLAREGFAGATSDLDMRLYAKGAAGTNRTKSENLAVLDRLRTVSKASKSVQSFIQQQVNTGLSVSEAKAKLLRLTKEQPIFIMDDRGEREINPFWLAEDGLPAPSAQPPGRGSSDTPLAVPPGVSIDANGVMTMPNGERIKVKM